MIPLVIPAWLANIWVRRAILVAVLMAAFLLLRQHYVDEGKRQGEQTQAQRSAAQIEQQRVADRAATEKQLAAIQSQIQQAIQSQQQDRQLFAALLAQRQQASTQAAKVPDEQLTPALHQALGNAASNQPLTAAEQRQALSCLYQLPICDQQVTTKQKEADAIKAERDGVKEQYREVATYTVGLEKLYTQLWNDKAQPRRSIKCLWLWHCDRPQIKTPAPEKLLRPAIVELGN